MGVLTGDSELLLPVSALKKRTFPQCVWSFHSGLWTASIFLWPWLFRAFLLVSPRGFSKAKRARARARGEGKKKLLLLPSFFLWWGGGCTFPFGQNIPLQA